MTFFYPFAFRNPELCSCCISCLPFCLHKFLKLSLYIFFVTVDTSPLSVSFLHLSASKHDKAHTYSRTPPRFLHLRSMTQFDPASPQCHISHASHPSCPTPTGHGMCATWLWIEVKFTSCSWKPWPPRGIRGRMLWSSRMKCKALWEACVNVITETTV